MKKLKENENAKPKLQDCRKYCMPNFASSKLFKIIFGSLFSKSELL